MDREELAAFLRTRRERITPADVGLPAGPRRRNLARRLFLGPNPQGRRLYGLSDADEFARSCAQKLRATAARYPGDPEVTGLVRELLAGSKTFQHPLVGPVTVDCDVLDISDRDQRVVIYTAAPGSPSEVALRLLSVIGTQRLDISG